MNSNFFTASEELQKEGKTTMALREGCLAFWPGKIGVLEIKNRLVRSATWENAASESGHVTDPLLDIYRALGKGGAGLIMTSHSVVHPRGMTDPRMIWIADDSYIPSVRKLARAVHEAASDCRVMIQLTHSGRQPTPGTGVEPVGPSAVYDEFSKQTPREMTLEEIEEVIEAFAHAIRRAREAELDGVELHGAHGYLLSSFLSPRTNRRKDRYGGSVENRCRIVHEIVERGHKEAGRGFPILIKMNTADYLPGGMDIHEAKKVAECLNQTGLAAFEMSGCTWETITRSEEELGFKPALIPEAWEGIKTKEQEAYFWQYAKEIRKVVDKPIILVGGIRSIGKVEGILEEGCVDFCAMCRPLVREPGLPNRWLRGEGSETAACISCNKCIPEEGPLRCVFNR
jgi:2,4-dienoyl-CoA reductase-like NADH-dependent reductase (Old Yellow Enzyme family)